MGRLTPLEEMIKIKKFLSFTKNWLLDVIPDFIDFVKIGHGNIKNIHTGKGSVVFYSILFISIPSTFYFIYLSIIFVFYIFFVLSRDFFVIHSYKQNFKHNYMQKHFIKLWP